MSLFITLEGPEGSGKTTQIERLTHRFDFAGIPYVRTREPGGTVVGSEIRAMLLHPNRPALSPEAEALLLSADRAQHVAEVVRPGLASGQVVISDRFLDSMLAHQGAGMGLDVAQLRRIGSFATGGIVPHLTILLDLEPELGLERRKVAFDRGGGEYNRIDQRDLDYHRRVRAGYLRLAAAEPERFFTVDASRSVREVAAQIWERVRPLVSAAQD